MTLKRNSTRAKRTKLACHCRHTATTLLQGPGVALEASSASRALPEVTKDSILVAGQQL
jgi:hypothetical protein